VKTKGPFFVAIIDRPSRLLLRVSRAWNSNHRRAAELKRESVALTESRHCRLITNSQRGAHLTNMIEMDYFSG
jgi:hypothetical protein